MLLLDALQAVVGATLVAWLPGYVWTRVLLPDLGRLERFLFSVGLSVAMMTLLLYLGNVLLAIRISGVHAVWYALFLTFAGLAFPVARCVERLLQARLQTPPATPSGGAAHPPGAQGDEPEQRQA